MNFISDNELDLKNVDYLNTYPYAKTLKEMILSVKQDKSFTIGLFGEWGSGKSSIVKTVQEEIEDGKNKFIIYDAWKYANDTFRRMFLLKVQEELKFEKTKLMNSFYLNESEDVKINKKFNFGYSILVILFAIIGIFLIFSSKISTDIKITIPVIIGLFSFFSGFFKKAFDEFKVNIQKPHLFAPEQFEACFDEMLTKSLKKYNKIQKFTKWVKGENHLKDIEKNFLGNKPNVIFLIPIDGDALKRHIKSNNSNSKEADEFLRKFFNVTLKIKSFNFSEIFDFTKEIIKANNLKFMPETIDIVSKEYASNPRRIIQFLNNLLSEIETYKHNKFYNETFAKEYESIIAKILIIKEEWPLYYETISKRPIELNNPAIISASFIFASLIEPI